MNAEKQYRRCHNNELYSHIEKTTGTIKKKTPCFLWTSLKNES